MIKKFLKKIKKWTQYKALYEEFKTLYKPGHYYSPITSLNEIQENWNSVKFSNRLPAIDLNLDEQIDILKYFKKYYKDLPFNPKKKNRLRYYFDNPNYSYADAIVLYSMIRYTKPKRIIEVGSGFSSCVTLDTNQYFFNNKIICSFIEPYPDLLRRLIKKKDLNKVVIKESKLQSIDVNYFKNLKNGDILFIDSTHVSKYNSDVNYIFFQILPSLNKGVYIHFHDIFYPFEYPMEWLIEGRSWNENYMLRAFLEYNDAYKIIFFNHYLWKTNKRLVEDSLPLFAKNSGGSIWLKKIK